MRDAESMCGNDLLNTSAIPTIQPGHDGAANQVKACRRIRLQDMDHWCCSVIGTCLTHDDLLAIARKRRVNIDADARTFEIHGFFVREAATAGPISKQLEKLLDTRYAGMVRRVARFKDAEELVEFWNASVSSGQVAGAYWALISHTHVPDDLRNMVFGEVHMMSHLMGGSARRIAGAAAELQARLDRVEQGHKRASVQAAEALAARDAEIADLKQALAEARAVADANLRREKSEPQADQDRTARLLEKKERALVAARTRARELEAEMAAMTERRTLALPATARQLPCADERRAPLRGLCGKAVLYLGGRKRPSGSLQKEAASANITLHCHDGGLDHSVHRLDELVERCDAVICPVNCINHQACIKAKQLCKRLNKPFLPIGSSGRGTFSRALDDLALRIGDRAAPSA